MSQGKISKYQYLYLSIPAMCDFCATGLQFIGLLLVPASIWQMLRGGTLALVAVFSVLFLGRKLYRHHIVGIVLVVIGITIIGIAAIIGTEPGHTDSDQESLGVILIVASLVL